MMSTFNAKLDIVADKVDSVERQTQANSSRIAAVETTVLREGIKSPFAQNAVGTPITEAMEVVPDDTDNDI